MRLPLRLLIAAAALGCALAAADVPARGDANAERAAASYAALQRYFLVPRSGLYRARYPGRSLAQAWPFSQALGAAVRMAGLPRVGGRYAPHVERRLRPLGRYWSAAAPAAYRSQVGPAGDVFYDDNEWIALELLEWYDLAHGRFALGRAERIFRLVVSGWDGDESHACPGGVFWTTAAGVTDRNAVTTAGGALLALRLYEETRRPGYLAWGRRMYDWTSSCLLAPNGLVWDHLSPDGIRDERQWSYNQGSMIGASLLLFRLAGDTDGLTRAEAMADAALASLDRTPTGPEPPYFLAVFYRHLVELADLDGRSQYREDAERYADSVWTTVRDRKTGLFRFGPRGSVDLLEQAAMVQIYAALAATAR